MAEPSDLPISSEGEEGLDLTVVGQRLREERAEVGARLATMTTDLESVIAASIDSNADDEHDPEGQTIAYERSQLSAHIRAAHDHLSGVDQAISRLEQGSYGTCEVCSKPIGAARLDAMPATRFCIEHA